MIELSRQSQAMVELVEQADGPWRNYGKSLRSLLRRRVSRAGRACRSTVKVRGNSASFLVRPQNLDPARIL